MKVQFEETKKRKIDATVGDIMQYRLSDNSTINRMIVMVAPGEYSMLDLDTYLCGPITTNSPNKLVNECRHQNNVVLYRKCEWDATLTIKPKYEVCE